MTTRTELLATDMFRGYHRVFVDKLTKIESELAGVVAQGGGWREGLPGFRHLLVLLETDVEHFINEEERLILERLRARVGMTPVLHDCYREHGEIRLETERFHRTLVAAACGHPSESLFEYAASLIDLLRVHMAREDEVLFLAAEQELTHQELLQISAQSPAWPTHRAA